MSQLGMGVMINRLMGSSETTYAIEHAIGKSISSINLDNNILSIGLENGKHLSIRDGGQSCCEYRYMRTDDDFDYYVGSKLVEFELAPSTYVDEENSEAHDIQFLHVKTDRGVITFSNHNIHNGYYGGFAITASLNDA